jgi:hypothetical protein
MDHYGHLRAMAFGQVTKTYGGFCSGIKRKVLTFLLIIAVHVMQIIYAVAMETMDNGVSYRFQYEITSSNEEKGAT